MAASKQFVGSVDKASEEYHEFVCSPCATDDRNIEAVKYCTQCKEYLCSRCLKEHNRFAAMKVHQLQDMAAMKGKQPSPGKFVPTEPCAAHLGNNIEVYCGNHDVVCCPTCVSLNHRSCVDITYIKDAAKGVTDSQEYKTMKSSSIEVKSELEKMKKKKQDNQKGLEKERAICLTQIQDFRKKIDDLEQEARNKVHAKYDEYKAGVDSDIKTLEEMIATLEKNVSKMEKVNIDDEPQVFIQAKMSKQNQHKGQQLLREMETMAKQEPLNYKINSDVENVINSVQSLGGFVEAGDQLYKATLIGHYDVNVKGERHCDIYGSCMLSDGKLLITDSKNHKLKLLDETYKVTDWCTLQGWPCGVCTTDPGEAAVACGTANKIQFVSLGQTMVPTATLDVGQDCIGVGYIKGQLFVSCQNPGQIKVYKEYDKGKLFRTIKIDESGQQIFPSPRHIAVSVDGTLIHVADKENGVITLDLQGNKLSQFSDPSLVGTRGVCPGVSGQLFVCGYSSQNVIQISAGGKKLDVILATSCGVKEPRSLYYDSANSRLIVCMTSDHIAVFQLSKK